jgi:hypothetical protein
MIYKNLPNIGACLVSAKPYVETPVYSQCKKKEKVNKCEEC